MCTISLKTEEYRIKFSNICCTETKLLQNKSNNNYDLGTSKHNSIILFVIYFVNLSKKVITQFPSGL